MPAPGSQEQSRLAAEVARDSIKRTSDSTKPEFEFGAEASPHVPGIRGRVGTVMERLKDFRGASSGSGDVDELLG